MDKQKFVCYCDKCGKMEKVTDLNQFRQHLKKDSTERCLEKGKYKQDCFSYEKGYLYVMWE